MEQHKQNKAFIIRYFNALSGTPKTKELVDEFVTDPALMDHINFFETAFPQYEVFMDELTAEGNRVVVKGRFKGCHMGEFNGVTPTQRTVEIPFAVSYEIENEKIVHHWLIADSMALMEQLGAMSVPA